MFEMKKQLDEIQKELRNLTQKTKKVENKTKGSYLRFVAYGILFQSSINLIGVFICSKV